MRPTHDEDDLRVRGDIERYGWHVALVPADENDPRGIGWAFTIGLIERFDHPEVAVFGLSPEMMHGLLNRAGDAVRRGWRLEPGREYSGFLEGFACALRPIAGRWVGVFFGNAQWHYRRADLLFLQICWPDPTKRFPWDPDLALEWRDDQPRLWSDDPELALPAALRASLLREGAL